jgi:hypothetical protein
MFLPDHEEEEGCKRVESKVGEREADTTAAIDPVSAFGLPLPVHVRHREVDADARGHADEGDEQEGVDQRRVGDAGQDAAEHDLVGHDRQDSEVFRYRTPVGESPEGGWLLTPYCRTLPKTQLQLPILDGPSLNTQGGSTSSAPSQASAHYDGT